MNASFVLAQNSPSVYKVKFDKIHELQVLYKEIILKDATINEVHQALVDYVTSQIEPVGWKAIWRTTSLLSFNCDIKVEILDVNRSELEATAVILDLISPTIDELDGDQTAEVKALISKTKVCQVPLIELYVISEDDEYEQYYNTALVIEHIRFFQENIWRPWDDIGTSTVADREIFAETRLDSRINFAFDMKNNVIPRSTVNRAKRLIKLDTEMYGNNFIDENVMYEAMRLKLSLDDIEREMKLLEDPYIRIIASNMRRDIDNESEDEEEDLGNYLVIHVVSSALSLKTLNNYLPKISKISDESGNDAKILFHNSIERAVLKAKVGGKIVLLPGSYKCGALPWIEKDIEIIGFGDKRSDVIIQSNDYAGDIFINCNASKMFISNLTLRASSEMQCILMLHTGLTRIVNCTLDGAKCARNTLVVLSKAQVSIDDSEIIHSEGYGISSRSGSIVKIDDIPIENKSLQDEYSNKDYEIPTSKTFVINHSPTVENGLRNDLGNEKTCSPKMSLNGGVLNIAADIDGDIHFDSTEEIFPVCPALSDINEMTEEENIDSC